MGGKEHEVVGQYAEVALALAGGLRATPEGTPQPAFVPTERGFRLPPLPIDAVVAGPAPLLAEALDHLPPVLGLRPFPAAPTTVQRDYRGADAQVLAAVAVMGFAVEGGVCQDPIPGDDQRRL